MKRIVLLCVLVVIVSCQFVFASSSDKWEYMVVSFGKAEFSQLLSKTMAYWDEGVSKDAYGASSYENNLDILGQHGWEVTSILGAIGGDQQVILKRLYDKNRTDAEVKEIAENSVLAAQGLLDSLIAADKAKEANAATKEPELIELDAYEAKIKKDAENAELTKAFDEATQIFFNTVTINRPTAWTTKYATFSPKITISYDVTKEYLINGNAYRKSEITIFLQSLEPMLKSLDSALKQVPRLKEVEIIITANIIYSGRAFKVGSATFGSGSNLWDKERKLRID